MRLIDADKLHYVKMLVQNPNNGKHKHIVAVRAEEINKAPTLNKCEAEDCISRQEALDAVNWAIQMDYPLGTVYSNLQILPSIYPKSDNEVAALEFSEDIDNPGKYQTSDGTWHTGMIPCDDAISRLAVIKAIDRYIEKVQSNGAKDDFISFEELVIKQLPRVYPKNEVLDKIRAEIGEVYEELDGYDPDSLGTFACRIDDIIDKYKAETEET